MKKSLMTMCLALGVCFLNIETATSQHQASASRFSHKGVKGSIGIGSFENEFGDKLKDGAAGAINLGYGFDDRFTLWLGVLGVQHPQNSVNREDTDFGGIEANLQYKLLAHSRIQPYGKLGLGIYGIGEKDSDTTFLGSGFTMGVGADWFFSRHFGVGAELLYKNIDYSKERREVLGQTVETELNPRLDGKSVGLLLTLTIQ